MKKDADFGVFFCHHFTTSEMRLRLLYAPVALTRVAPDLGLMGDVTGITDVVGIFLIIGIRRPKINRFLILRPERGFLIRVQIAGQLPSVS